MNLAFNIISVALIIACLVYIYIKKDKNLVVLIISSIILAVLLSQIVLDEIVRAQILAFESIKKLDSILNIVKYLNWGKTGLIFILAVYCWYIKYEADDGEVENEKM